MINNKKLAAMTDFEFAAFILQQKLDKISNPNLPMAAKLRSAIAKLNGMKELRTVVITCNEPDCSPWVTPFSSQELAEEFVRKAREKIEEFGAHGVRVYTDSMGLDREDYLGWLDDEYAEREV